VLGTQQGFGAAGAFLKMQPDYRGAFGRFHRLGNGGFGTGRQAHGDGQRGAKLEKVAPRHVETILDIVQRCPS
jgi:hypothetical protein